MRARPAAGVNRNRTLLARLATLLALQAPLQAAPDAPLPPAHALDQVTVEAQRATLEQRLYAYVSVVTRPAHDESIKRWVQPLCPLVAGLPQAQGEFMLERISRVTRDAGAPLGGQDCRPNFYIVASADPPALLRAWDQRDPRLFGRGPPAAVQAFMENPRPVRVWYNASFGASDGGPVTDNAPELGTNYAPGATVNRRARDSRLRLQDVLLLSSVIVVVDMQKVRGLQYGQLADYVAMFGLTQLNPDAELGNAPSILQLFKVPAPGSTPPSGLTRWDQAFLKALYATDQASVKQRSSITQAMLQALPP